MKKILLLEDDVVLAESLLELLEAEDFKVTHIYDSQEALEQTFQHRFDIYLFDVNVPQFNGFELLKSLRDAGDTTPAIFVTALNDIASLAKGFDVGADDYIKKPFDFDELLIRIHAILKKQFHSYANQIRLGAFCFDIEKDELYYEGRFVPLSAYELKLTQLFFQNIDKTLSKEFLLQELGYDKSISDGSLRVYMTKLRKYKLPITTIKGVGYRLSSS
jgi:DNA-binding response OmpR family regulator